MCRASHPRRPEAAADGLQPSGDLATANRGRVTRFVGSPYRRGAASGSALTPAVATGAWAARANRSPGAGCSPTEVRSGVAFARSLPAVRGESMAEVKRTRQFDVAADDMWR